MDYIFGYGSLICADSRKRTGLSGDAHPIEVKGIVRRWSVHPPDWPATAVSVHEDEQSWCNGVYFPVDQDNLKRFDDREQGYNRILLDWSLVKAEVPHALPVHGRLWVYVGVEDNPPSPERPIMQSYLDVVLNGCLEYGDHFAERFAVLTENWQHLIDDRHDPVYLRPLKSQQRIIQVDSLLRKILPDLKASD